MHLSSITYRAVSYPLGHLSQSIRPLPWRTQPGENVVFSVRLRYSNHCYSRELKDGAVPEDGDVIVEKDPPVRVFCPLRHDQTPILCQMIDGLFTKPTSRVALTKEDNWTVFHLYSKPTQNSEPRYCAFFRMRRSQAPVGNGHVPLDMYVESGYGRTNRVDVIRHAPFGRAAEDAAFKP